MVTHFACITFNDSRWEPVKWPIFVHMPCSHDLASTHKWHELKYTVNENTGITVVTLSWSTKSDELYCKIMARSLTRGTSRYMKLQGKSSPIFDVPHIAIQHSKFHLKKVQFSRYRPGMAQRAGRGIALLFHDHGTRRGWVVSSTPRPHFTPGKDPVPILQEVGWAPGSVGRAETLNFILHINVEKCTNYMWDKCLMSWLIYDVLWNKMSHETGGILPYNNVNLYSKYTQDPAELHKHTCFSS
jgi:hypothetical protein